MKWQIIVYILIFAGVLFDAAFSAGPNFRDKILDLTASFRGDVGLYARHLSTGEMIAIQADTLFPTASMIKVPIMLSLFQQLEDRDLSYQQELSWHPDSVNYPYDGLILWAYEPGKPISINVLVSLMISYSDNHASLWCQKLAGGGEGINRWLAAAGYAGTRVNSRTPGRDAPYKKYGWGQTTPREMAEMLVSIREGTAVSAAASEEMYRVLSRPYWNDIALAQLPPHIQAAAKNGAVSQSRSEVVLVNAPSGDYVFCVITKNQQDTRWLPANEGEELIRAISRLLWDHFEPGSSWAPARGSSAFRE